MRRLLSFASVLAVLGGTACRDATSPAGPLAPNRSTSAVSVVDETYIVTLRNVAASNAPAVAAQLAAAHGGTVAHVYKYALVGFAARFPAAAVSALQRNANVAYVEADRVFSIDATQTGATWGLDRIDQRDRPLSGTYTYDANGTGVTVYIIDTGIRTTHQEFGGRASSGFTSISDGNGTNDCNGHGTHVSGTIGGSTYGVAKNVSLVAVRVLSCQGSGTTSGVVAGIDWVTGHHSGPSVANMSLGGGASSTLDNAVANSVASGVTYAVAAGNSNANACYYSPARAAAAITVGATTSSDARSSYSNYGSCVDLFAPGSSITSAWATSDGAINTISGTSMATPHVAGVAALVLQGNPNASPATVTQAIESNASLNKVTSAGTGSPNLLLYSVFSGSGGGGGTDEPPPAGSFVLTVNMSKTRGVNSANLSWTGAGGSADVYRDDSKIASSVSGTSYTDNLGKGGGTHSWKVCNAGTSTCSNSVTRTY
jgi:aqualysin 1